MSSVRTLNLAGRPVTLPARRGYWILTPRSCSVIALALSLAACASSSWTESGTKIKSPWRSLSSDLIYRPDTRGRHFDGTSADRGIILTCNAETNAPSRDALLNDQSQKNIIGIFYEFFEPSSSKSYLVVGFKPSQPVFLRRIPPSDITNGETSITPISTNRPQVVRISRKGHESLICSTRLSEERLSEERTAKSDMVERRVVVMLKAWKRQRLLF